MVAISIRPPLFLNKNQLHGNKKMSTCHCSSPGRLLHCSRDTLSFLQTTKATAAEYKRKFSTKLTRQITMHMFTSSSFVCLYFTKKEKKRKKKIHVYVETINSWIPAFFVVLPSTADLSFSLCPSQLVERNFKRILKNLVFAVIWLFSLGQFYKTKTYLRCKEKSSIVFK